MIKEILDKKDLKENVEDVQLAKRVDILIVKVIINAKGDLVLLQNELILNLLVLKVIVVLDYINGVREMEIVNYKIYKVVIIEL